MREILNLLKNEIELILNDELREFAVEAVDKMAKLFVDEGISFKKTSAKIKRVVEEARKICKAIDADDRIMDMMTVAGLIHMIYDDGINQLFAFMPRILLDELIPIIGRDQFNSIMFLVERQQGFACPIAEVRASIDDPIHVWILPIAIHLSKGDV